MTGRHQERVDLAHATPFSLGTVQFYPSHRLIRNGAHSIIVEPRVMRLLVALARADGAILSRDDLIEECWGGRIVGDNAIQTAISRARSIAEAFGGRDFKIETIKGVGYRLRSTDESDPTLIRADSTAPQGPQWAALTMIGGWAAAALAVIVATTLLWHPGQPRSTTPIVAVVAAQDSPQSSALAHDMLIHLGSLQANNTDAFQLVGAGSADRPTFTFEISGLTTDRTIGANLALFNGRNRTLLWAKSFRQPLGREADLRPQLAYSAAQVLRCASEAKNGGGDRLRAETEKLYLNGCAEFAENLEANPASVVPIFARVAGDAPSFRDGWAKLLLAESRFLSDSRSTERTRVSLLRHIAQARARHPDLPEIRLAEIKLLPVGAFSERLRLADRAKRIGPDNPFVLTSRAEELMRVGRLNEAVADAARAAELAPLSPSVSNTYISALAYSGRTAMAEAALKEAERLWPGTSTIQDAKFRFHFRYGDPAIAKAILPSRTDWAGRLDEAHEAFLQARMEPSPENVDRAAQVTRGHLAFLSQTLGEFGRADELYEAFDLSIEPNVADPGVLFRPALKTFRQDPRFMRVADRLRLVEYWRGSGHWPDFCFEPDLPYDCKIEAAKIAR